VAILIILNNYLHDVATATLLSSAVILYVLGRQAQRGGVDEHKAFARSYRTLTRMFVHRKVDHPQLVFVRDLVSRPALSRNR
jgi:DNA integrity scanning protein DisA with diadenylate cyclase activity